MTARLMVLAYKITSTSLYLINLQKEDFGSLFFGIGNNMNTRKSLATYLDNLNVTRELRFNLTKTVSDKIRANALSTFTELEYQFLRGNNNQYEGTYTQRRNEVLEHLSELHTNWSTDSLASMFTDPVYPNIPGLEVLTTSQLKTLIISVLEEPSNTSDLDDMYIELVIKLQKLQNYFNDQRMESKLLIGLQTDYHVKQVPHMAYMVLNPEIKAIVTRIRELYIEVSASRLVTLFHYYGIRVSRLEALANSGGQLIPKHEIRGVAINSSYYIYI